MFINRPSDSDFENYIYSRKRAHFDNFRYFFDLLLLILAFINYAFSDPESPVSVCKGRSTSREYSSDSDLSPPIKK